MLIAENNGTHNIIFVCSGNTCRSPMAEAFAKDWVRRNAPREAFSISSAGIHAADGFDASAQAICVMESMGLSLAFHSTRRFTQSLVGNSLIVAMTDAQAQVARRIAPNARVVTIAAWAGYGLQDIVDPFGRGFEAYDICARQIRSLVEAGMKRMVGDRGR